MLEIFYPFDKVVHRMGSRLNINIFPFIILAMFCLASLEIHADHDEMPSQTQSQQCDCCLQCCPAHNLAPMQRVFVSNIVPTVAHSVSVSSNQINTQTFPKSIFRPPIV